MSKMKSTYSIDLNEIEADIARCDAQIENYEASLKTARNDRAVFIALKEYIISKYGAAKVNGLTQSKAAPPSAGNSRRETLSPREANMSDFIRDFLVGKKHVHTMEIAKAFAEHVGVDYNNVQLNISKALGRLKISNQVENEKKPGAKRASSFWALKE
jgi:hypothetical protein